MSNKKEKFELYRYLQNRSENVFASINDRTIIYLDMNYWIRLRNGETKKTGQDTELFQLVSDLHSSRKCIFPISEYTFWELLKQKDVRTRTATVKLIDRFSEGIAIGNMEHRIVAEINHWLKQFDPMTATSGKAPIWAKINTVMNYTFVQTKPAELREHFLDFVSFLPLELILGDKEAQVSIKDDIEKLNREIKAHAHENKTLEEMFLAEIGGFIAEQKERINEVQEYNQYEIQGTIPENDRAEENKVLDRIIFHGFRLKKITNQLPVLHIFPTMHSWTRWIQKDFKDGNDTFDFMHATAALPYADYFFTERRLTSGIIASELDTTYNCVTKWKYEEVLAQLKQL